MYRPPGSDVCRSLRRPNCVTRRPGICFHQPSRGKGRLRGASRSLYPLIVVVHTAASAAIRNLNTTSTKPNNSKNSDISPQRCQSTHPRTNGSAASSSTKSTQTRHQSPHPIIPSSTNPSSQMTTPSSQPTSKPPRLAHPFSCIISQFWLAIHPSTRLMSPSMRQINPSSHTIHLLRPSRVTNGVAT